MGWLVRCETQWTKVGKDTLLRPVSESCARTGSPLYVAANLRRQGKLRSVLHGSVYGHSAVCAASGVRGLMSVLAALPSAGWCWHVRLRGRRLLDCVLGDLCPVHVHVLCASGLSSMAYDVGLWHVRMDAASTKRAACQARGNENEATN